MINTTQKRTDYDPVMPTTAVAKNVGSLTHDLITLAELQWELLQVDTSRSIRRLLILIVVGVVAAAMLVGCVPVALIALGYVLTEQFELSMSASMICSAGVGVVIGALLLLVAYLLSKQLTAGFDESKSEFAKNVQWLKSTLRHR